MRRRWVAYLALALALVALIGGLWLVLGPAEHSPLGAGRDWGLHFYPAARAFGWRQDPYAVPGVYNPPWLFLALAPLALLPERLAWVLLAGTTLALALGTAGRFGGRRWPALLLAGTSPYLLATMLQGQVDGVGLAGLLIAAVCWGKGEDAGRQAERDTRHGRADWLGPALALGAALLLLTAKPQAALPAVALLVLRLLTGPWRRGATALGAALALAGLCSAWIGWDWPWRIADNARRLPPLPLPRVDAWMALQEMGVAHPARLLVPLAAALIGLLIWTYRREGWSDRLLSMAIVGGLLLTPYLSGPSLLLGAASALPWLARRGRWGFALPAYGLAWAASFLRWEPTFRTLGVDLWPGVVLFVGLAVADLGPDSRERGARIAAKAVARSRLLDHTEDAEEAKDPKISASSASATVR